jgi:hypothetical protein
VKHIVGYIGRDAYGPAIPKADFNTVLSHRISVITVAASKLRGQFHRQKPRRRKRKQALAPQLAPPLVNVLPSNVMPPSDIRHPTTLHLSFRTFSSTDQRRRRSGPDKISWRIVSLVDDVNNDVANDVN